ncbi:MAG: hypothetical protein WA197_08290 [Candidatus Acidiferrales bacterium]
MKKLVLAIVATYVVLMLTNYLIHSVWLASDYAAIPDSHRSISRIMRHFWIMAIGQVFFAAMFGYIYTRGRERKPWLVQGIRYGIIMTCMTVIPYSLTEYVVYIIPYQLAIKWMVAGLIQLIVLGVLVAGICTEQSA